MNSSLNVTTESSSDQSSTPTFSDALKIFIIFLLVSLAIIMTTDFFLPSPPKTPLDLLYTIFFTHVIGILVPVFIYIKVKKYNLKESLNIKPVPILTLLKISVIAIIFFILLNWFQELLAPVFKPYEKDIIEYQDFFTTIASAGKSRIDIILFIIGVSAIPAIVEEILFRGIILNGLKNSSTAVAGHCCICNPLEANNSSNSKSLPCSNQSSGTLLTGQAIKAILLSGLLFGIIHFLPPQIVMTSILGIFFGILVIKTQSIITSIWCHFLNNLIIILSIFAQPN
ncbi:MAG: type II CAAX endopeptidase family protein [Planctomycetota bacterium]